GVRGAGALLLTAPAATPSPAPSTGLLPLVGVVGAVLLLPVVRVVRGVSGVPGTVAATAATTPPATASPGGLLAGVGALDVIALLRGRVVRVLRALVGARVLLVVGGVEGPAPAGRGGDGARRLEEDAEAGCARAGPAPRGLLALPGLLCLLGRLGRLGVGRRRDRGSLLGRRLLDRVLVLRSHTAPPAPTTVPHTDTPEGCDQAAGAAFAGSSGPRKQ